MLDEEAKLRARIFGDGQQKNKVAVKFSFVKILLQLFGYGGAVVSTIIFCQNDNVGWGFICGIITAIVTWFLSLFWEGIAEILQLLEDIKNK